MQMFLGERDKEKKKLEREQKRLDDLEYRRACCVCESTMETSRFELDDTRKLELLFDQTMRGFLCSTCNDIAKVKLNTSTSASTQAPTTVTKRGEWTCHFCSTKNSAFAKVCDKCSTKRATVSQGEEFIVPVPKEGEELGIDCEIQGGAVTLVHVAPGSIAAKAGVPLGVLTTIDGGHVHTAFDLKRAIVNAKGKKSQIALRVASSSQKAKKSPGLVPAPAPAPSHKITPDPAPAPMQFPASTTSPHAPVQQPPAAPVDDWGIEVAPTEAPKWEIQFGETNFSAPPVPAPPPAKNVILDDLFGPPSF